jgi:hypothetical protein
MIQGKKSVHATLVPIGRPIPFVCRPSMGAVQGTMVERRWQSGDTARGEGTTGRRWWRRAVSSELDGGGV